MMTRRKGLLGLAALAFAGLMATAVPARATPADAAKFVQELGDRAIAVVSDTKAGPDQRKAIFRDLLNANFDVPTIGRFVLGRYWNMATPQQREEYLKLFETMIVDVYAGRFSQYAGEQFKVTGANPESERDAVVTSQVIRPGEPSVGVAWRVRQKDGSFKIIDVVVENVSMSVTQRSEFASLIENNGGRFDALLDALRQRIQTAQTQ